MQAVESACSVIEVLSPAQVVCVVTDVIVRLAQGDWFTSCVSACGLIPAAYAKLVGVPGDEAAATRRRLRELLDDLSHHDTPMVKRAVAKTVGPLSAVIEPEAARELLESFKRLAVDDQDSVRLVAIENCTALCAKLTVADNRAAVLPMVKAWANDKSWRVRCSVAREYAVLSASMGGLDAVYDLLPGCVRLLHDPEGEVRASAAKNVARYYEVCGAEAFLSQVCGAVLRLAGDGMINVKTAVAESLTVVAGKMSPQEVSAAHLSSVFLDLLRDEAPEVRLKTLECLGRIAEAVGPDFLSGSVVPLLATQAADLLWRIREKVIEQLPMLARHLGAAAFEDRLLPLYLNAYSDHVNSVRMAATRVLQPLARTLGLSWTRSRLMPRLSEQYNTVQSSYLSRITVLYGLKELCVPDLADLVADMLPLLTGSSIRDPVPNVRFVAAQVLQEAAQVLDRARVRDEVRPALLRASTGDADLDVRFFASSALERM
jgi:serine/threonine-protein phosphatase 2A regulatory subunit A